MKIAIKKPAPPQEKIYEKVIHHRKGVDPSREFDKTQLRSAGYADKVHRDYAAHFFRWGWAGNFVKRHTRVLEVGCGQDCPLVRVLSGNMSTVPERYVGVDLNRIPNPFKVKWGEFKDNFNYVENAKQIEGKFDLIVNFEVIEHMKKESGRKLLTNMKNHLVAGTGRLLLSTPVYNGKHMAANHLHEYEFEELKDMIEDVGLQVEAVHGTFMTSHAMKKACTPEEWALIEELHEFHSWEVMATFIASKYPKHSSNCAWVLSYPDEPPF